MNKSIQKPEILLYTTRCDCIDSQYFGSVFLANKNEIYKHIGLDSSSICFLRSLAKPLQTSILTDCNIINDFKLTPKEIAIMCASHAGSSSHIDIIKNLMKKFKINLSDLELIAQNPLDTRNFNGKKTKLHNNCSAKHVMMVAMSKYLGFETKNYTNINHPIQKLIKEKQEQLSEYKSTYISYDGCSTPLWGLPYKNIIKAYSNFFKDKNYTPIVSSILKNSYIYGGFNRLDTKIIKDSKGKLFSKVGAGGLVLVYNFQKDEILLVKMTQNNNEARELITYDILNKLNWIKTKLPEFEYNQKNQPSAKYCYEFRIS